MALTSESALRLPCTSLYQAGERRSGGAVPLRGRGGEEEGDGDADARVGQSDFAD
jgi:hypothetical protein